MFCSVAYSIATHFLKSSDSPGWGVPSKSHILIDILVVPGFSGLLHVTLMQIVVNGLHCRRRGAVFLPVLLNEFYRFIVQRCGMTFLLGGDIIAIYEYSQLSL